MRYFIFLLAVLHSMVSNAQSVIFSQDFETQDMAGWLSADNDGDGIVWELVLSSEQAQAQGWGEDMTLMMGSFAYNLFPGQEAPLNPDNLLITPLIDLPENQPIYLSFKIGTNVEFMNNHNFELYITEDFQDVETREEAFFTMNFEGISTAQDINLDISEFAGSSVYLVFRHFDSEAQFVLLLDDILVTTENLSTIENQNHVFAVYPNPTTEFVQIRTHENIIHSQLFDASGRALRVQLIQNKMNLSTLPAGLYMLKIKTENKTYFHKIIKK
ncbi:MAG: T9SS type A sorting domain-containing protein [Flavobacteriaceae bacterium]|nr:T9SS type A sorting domain-containing protein [Flavobacteriaceae bacterium]